MTITILQGDVVEKLKELPDKSVHCTVTSPPYYGLRNYGVEGQIGLEKTPELYVQKLVEVFREVKRVLRNDGTLWLNLGDSYGSGNRKTQVPQTVANGCDQDLPLDNRGKAGYSKQMIGIPWRVAFALQADGWYLRSDIIWNKPNPMPESVTDRPTKSHEYIFLLTKKAQYYYDADAIREPHQSDALERTLNPNHKYGKASDSFGNGETAHQGMGANPAGRNRRTVWEIATQPTPEAHFATFPEALVEPCIKAGTSERGCCAKCGSPHERMIEKGETINRTSLNGQGNGELNKSGRFGDAVSKHIGWQSSCTCNADTVPCVVLDPFGGSGTTAKVARDLKRDCILIELNPAYVKIMKNKLRLNEQLGV